ncbi:MAG: PAS domain-containing protein [Proteobacteria bacterium]|nr:PAS domain-containing protein [Pseudomonadota bacterium]
MPEKIKLMDWIREHLFNVVPMSIAVIDRDFNLVYANKPFEEKFGKWKGKKCFSVYKSSTTMCLNCKGAEAFQDGKPRVNEEIGFDKSGKLTKYIKHTMPVVDSDGSIPFLVEMATDITEASIIKKEYQLLFDQVPCSILVIDRNFRIVRTNKKIRETFGDLTGKYCYSSLKGFNDKCLECTARDTFSDGEMHTGNHVWRTKDGEDIHSHVSTVPLFKEDGTFDMVMEMAVDITHTLELEDELKIAYSFMETMIATAIDGIIAIDIEGDIIIFNKAARDIFNIHDKRKMTKIELEVLLPEGFMAQVLLGPGHVYLPEAYVKTIDDDKKPVRLSGNKIEFGDGKSGMAFSIQDLRELKRLESEKLEAERMAAVGQTVAGLAHGVKNLITGLEGGMYMMNSGMKKGDVDRIQKGLEMLDRNILRVSTFVKEFLNFSKGRKIKVGECEPGKIARDVVELYASQAGKFSVELICETDDNIMPALMDGEGIHECLTNLVGNAIDACRMSDNQGGNHVWVKTHEKDDVIVYEVVDDGCGMDYEVKKKVFTNFFTTKGLGGTGIGLLTTKKIVQEHGGKIELQSEEGKGTTFRIRLPRNRLPKPESIDI